MAGTTCTICLDDAVSPVSVPCGHIHCEACLVKCIEQAEDPVEALCPTCRTPFNIATPDLRFVPAKYHPFLQSSVRRVFLSPSGTVQDLQDRVDELEGRVERLQSKNDALKLHYTNSKKDVNKLMERCEAHIDAIANYREKEREMREEKDRLCEAIRGLEEEAGAWKKKYQEMKEKYKQLKRSVVPHQTAPSSSSTKRNSTQAALDVTHAGPSHESDPSRRLIAPIPKRPRLATSWRSTVGEMEVDSNRPQQPPVPQPTNHTNDFPEDTFEHNEFADGVHASSQPSPTRIRVSRRQNRPLRTGLTMVLENMDVASSDIDEEEKDGPSKARAARSSRASEASESASSASRYYSPLSAPPDSSQPNVVKSRKPKNSGPLPSMADIFGSVSAGPNASRETTWASIPSADVDELDFPPISRSRPRAPAREYVFRGRRIVA